MNPGLELQLRVGAFSGDPEDHLLEAVLFRSAGGELLGLPAMALGVTEVHLVEIAREQRGLFAALPGTDLDDDVLLIERIARHELRAKTRAELCHFVGRFSDLLTRQVAQIRIVAVRQVARLGEPLLRGAKGAHGVDHRLERGELLPDRTQAGGGGRRRGIGKRAAQLVVTPLAIVEPFAQPRRQRVGHVAASASRSPAMAPSSDATATSIIRASGRLVVIRCNSRPGAMRTRMTGRRSCAAPSLSTS